MSGPYPLARLGATGMTHGEGTIEVVGPPVDSVQLVQIPSGYLT